MLASHNTLTFLPARRWWARLLTPWWRCQDKDITGQREAGARMLDIRVRLDRKGRWRPCHGHIDLGKVGYPAILDLITDLGAHGTPMRIVLERGDDCRAFEEQITRLLAYDIPVTVAAIKKPWREVYSLGIPYDSADEYFKPIDTARPWWRQLRTLAKALWTTPLSYAQHNPAKPTDNTDNIYHFRDFI